MVKNEILPFQETPPPDTLIEVFRIIANHETSETPEVFLNEMEVPRLSGLLIDMYGQRVDRFLTYKTLQVNGEDHVLQMSIYPNAKAEPSVLHLWATDKSTGQPVSGVVIPVDKDLALDNSRPVTSSGAERSAVNDLVKSYFGWMATGLESELPQSQVAERLAA